MTWKWAARFYFTYPFGINQPISSQCSHLLAPEKNRKPNFSDVFRSYKKGTLARNGLMKPRHLATAWKGSKYGVFSDPYFPTFGLNTTRYGVYLRIQSECGKIRTRKNSVFGHFSRCAMREKRMSRSIILSLKIQMLIHWIKYMWTPFICRSSLLLKPLKG